MSKQSDRVRKYVDLRASRKNYGDLIHWFNAGLTSEEAGLAATDIRFLLSELDRKDKALRRITEMPFPHRVGFADCVAIARAALAEQEEA